MSNTKTVRKNAKIKQKTHKENSLAVKDLSHNQNEIREAKCQVSSTSESSLWYYCTAKEVCFGTRKTSLPGFFVGGFSLFSFKKKFFASD